MPCYQIRETQIDLSVANIDLLQEALETEGFKVSQQGNCLYANNVSRNTTVSFRNGKLKFQQFYNTADSVDKHKEMANSIKRAYSVASVKYASKRFGWNVKQQPNGKFLAVKRV